MANKYIIHGATYCGDGTSSAVASSNGGVGAWNDINVFEGTAPAYGTAPAAGDVVYIRSKTSAGADITRTVTANISIGSASTTFAAPITWVIDSGDVWSGVSGTLTYNITSGNPQITFMGHNTTHASVEDALIFQISQASYYAYLFYMYEGSVVSNAWFRLNAVKLTSGGPGVFHVTGAQNGICQLINPRISIGVKLLEYVVKVGAYSTLIVSTPRITLDAGPYGTTPLFLFNGPGSSCFVYGGSISGSTSAQVLASMYNGDGVLEFHGTSLPANLKYRSAEPTTVQGSQRIEGWGVDGGVGAFSVRGGGVIDSRQDGYYPVLNGTYPNSTNQGWSWKVTPSNATMETPLDVISAVIYTADSAVRTITTELLVANDLVNAGITRKGRIWLTVTYTDNTTGAIKTVSSINIGNVSTIDSSTALWSATSYGPTLLQKRKITLTTPTAIKKDTLITTVLRWTEKAISTTDIAFVDPEPVVI